MPTKSKPVSTFITQRCRLCKHFHYFFPAFSYAVRLVDESQGKLRMRYSGKLQVGGVSCKRFVRPVAPQEHCDSAQKAAR